MFNQDIVEENLEDRDSIIKAYNNIMTLIANALNQGRPFIVTGVILDQNRIAMPMGLSFGDENILREMLPFFKQNNEILFKRLAPPVKSVSAETTVLPSGGCLIRFLN